jgi:hypothetical protein
MWILCHRFLTDWEKPQKPVKLVNVLASFGPASLKYKSEARANRWVKFQYQYLTQARPHKRKQIFSLVHNLTSWNRNYWTLWLRRLKSAGHKNKLTFYIVQNTQKTSFLPWILSTKVGRVHNTRFWKEDNSLSNLTLLKSYKEYRDKTVTFTFSWKDVYVSDIKTVSFSERRNESKVIILEGLGGNVNSCIKQQGMTERQKIKFQWLILKPHTKFTGNKQNK